MEYGSINSDETRPLISPERVNQHERDFGFLRAAVFGFSDGLCTNLNVVVGMYVAMHQSSISNETTDVQRIILMTGLCGLFGGASSMAAGEWLSSRADTIAKQMELKKERRHHETIPDIENADMQKMLEESGLSTDLAQSVSQEVAGMSIDKRVAFHAKYELGMDDDDVKASSSVFQAVYMWFAFALGALLPILPWIHEHSQETTPSYNKILFGSTLLLSLLGVLCSSAVQLWSVCTFTMKDYAWSVSRQLSVAIATVSLSILLNYYITSTV